MHKQRGFTAFELFWVAVIVLGLGGWIANIVKLIGMIDDPLTAMFVARIVGVFATPVGAILGFM